MKIRNRNNSIVLCFFTDNCFIPTGYGSLVENETVTRGRHSFYEVIAITIMDRCVEISSLPSDFYCISSDMDGILCRRGLIDAIKRALYKWSAWNSIMITDGWVNEGTISFFCFIFHCCVLSVVTFTLSARAIQGKPFPILSPWVVFVKGVFRCINSAL